MTVFQYLALTTASLMVGLTIAACTPTVAKRGNSVDDENLRQIKVGESTREDVARILGSPTQMSTFDDKIWYYIGRRTEQSAFLDPELIEQKIVAIKFTPEGMVEKINQGSNKYAEVIDPINAKTPTYGKEVTIMQQLLGNLGRPTIPTGNSNK